MGDEETPSGPPRFPPVEDGDLPPPGYDWHGQRSPYGARRHWLHPLDVGGAFSAGWRLYRYNWRAMVGALLMITLPLAVLTALFEAAVARDPSMLAWQDAYASAVLSRDLSTVPLPPSLYWLSLGVSLVSAFFSFIATAAVVYLVDAGYRGGRPGPMSALSAAFSRTGTLITIFVLLFLGLIAVGVVGGLAATLLLFVGFMVGGASLAVFLGLVGLVGIVAAFVFFATRWSLYVQTVMCERLRARAALGRSWRLVAGSTWRVLGYLLLLGLATVFVLLAVGIVVGIVVFAVVGPPTPGAIVSLTLDPVALVIVSVIGTLLSAAVSPWYVAVMTLLYYDLRWRRGEALTEGAPVSPEASAA